MSDGDGGGAWALAGFLYQILSTWALTACASSPIPISDYNGLGEIDALLTLIGVGEGLQAQVERFADAVFTRDDKCVIVEFKYSSTSRKISKPETKKIITSLDRGAKKAESQGQNVTACVLFTNRRLTSRGGRAAKQYWEAEQQRERCYRLHYHLDSMASPTRKLRGFAKKYGLFDHEIKQGVYELVGRVFSHAGDLFGLWLDEGHLVESFTGCREARPLTVDVIRKQSLEEIDRFGETVPVERWNHELVEREVFESIIQAINEQRALIQLYGPGGCGKSIIIWQLLDRLPPKRCCTVIHAEELLKTWVEGTVHSWRNLPGSTGDTADVAVQRLIEANPTSPRPIMWLALDGLDEGHLSPDCKSNIRKVLRWFCDRDRNRTDDPPLATLIVTCREESDLRNWLQWPPFSSRELPPTIHVGNFSDREFKKALDRKFPGLHDRIQQRFGIQPEALGDDYDTSVFGSSLPSDTFDSLDGRVLESLRHPAMWLAILHLDCKVQIRAIKGEPQAVHALARRFIEWFGYKLGQRKQQLQDLVDNGCDDLVEILKVIAQHSSGTVANSRDEGWVEPARRTPHRLSGREAEILYDEAISAGLVEEDSCRV